MIAAFLASMGIFNIFVVYGLSILGDVLGDIIVYSIGKFGGRPLLEKIERWFHLNESVMRKVEKGFAKHGTKFVFYAKISTGLSFVTFAFAGIAEMKFTRFLKYSILGGIFWSAFLVLMGYFFGTAAEQISQHIKYAGVVIFFIALLVLIGVIIYKKKKTAKIFPNNNENN